MIIYNVTCNVADEIHDEWVQWMKEVHLPEVMETGLFLEHKMMKILTEVEDNTGTNYAIQYLCQSMDDYTNYSTNFGPALKQKTLEKYGDKVMAFRTLMELT